MGDDLSYRRVKDDWDRDKASLYEPIMKLNENIKERYMNVPIDYRFKINAKYTTIDLCLRCEGAVKAK